MASDTKAVFISYRRDESAGYAGRIADSFEEHFGEDIIFRDIDSLEPGLDFAEAIESAIESSEVLIAVIGKNWLNATDAAGRKRLENPDDYVRTEIATALRRNIRVIPLLVQDAAMPSASELPEDLAPLSRRNAFELNDSSWRDDIRRLVNTLDRAIKGNRPPKPDEPGVVKQPEEIQPEEKQRVSTQQLSSFKRMFLLYPPYTSRGWKLHTVFLISVLCILVMFITMVAIPPYGFDYLIGWLILSTPFVIVCLIIRSLARRDADKFEKPHS
jgi:TIR domain